MAFRPKWILILCALAALESTVRPNSSTNAPAIAVSPDDSLSDSPLAKDLIAATQPSVATNPPAASTDANSVNINTNLAMAIYYVNLRQPEKAEPLLVALLAGDNPESLQKTALFELGNTVRAENDLPRAQTIYTQYIQRWPNDPKVTEILLRQGENFRAMGLNELALGKFYSVMTSALALKDGQFDYYQKLVLQTQVEIAETHYMMGQFSDAADFYLRLIQNADPGLNREQVQFHLVRSLNIIGRNDQAAAQAQDFITRFPDSDQVPETRYYLAESLKALGRNAEALQQVLLCLQEQKSRTSQNPEVWAYWQQRIGNEIGNQLYHEGDYVKSLEVYMNLEQLNPAPSWQIPVEYQMGMTYEKLLQPEKAAETYQNIVSRQNEAGTNSTPALQAVFDMARWRINFIQWQTNADAVDHSIGMTTARINSTNQHPASATP
jgi:tetratricopeptide (TPR) repeat protein